MFQPLCPQDSVISKYVNRHRQDLFPSRRGLGGGLNLQDISWGQRGDRPGVGATRLRAWLHLALFIVYISFLLVKGLKVAGNVSSFQLLLSLTSFTFLSCSDLLSAFLPAVRYSLR